MKKYWKVSLKVVGIADEIKVIVPGDIEGCDAMDIAKETICMIKDSDIDYISATQREDSKCLN